MKTKTLLSILAFVLIVSAFGQRPTMELTFTAEKNGQSIPLNSILINNLTQGVDTTLYAPDTVLMLDYNTSISDNETIEKNTLSVSQNYPNPFTDMTTINLYLPKRGSVKVIIQDIFGRVLADHESTLSFGNHFFAFYPGNEKYYLLTVTGKQTSQTIKMVNSNSISTNARKCKIVYIENTKNNIGLKSQKAINAFVFNIGDELKYIAYTEEGEKEIIDTPSSSQIYTFQFEEWTPCPEAPTVTDIDGNIYNTVQIGGQCWMKENLRVGTRIDGSQEMTNNSMVEKYCYDNDPANCETYGGLYQWNEMMQYTITPGLQGICPSDWHLPTDDEWKTMEIHLGMTQEQADATSYRGTDEGDKIKEAGITHWYSPNLGATNSSGFTALPGGICNSDGSFHFLTTGGTWWSSSEYSGTHAWYRSMNYNYSQVARGGSSRAFGVSVRCIKN